MKKRMHAVAIIPARGGSKGIPRKNLCAVGGVPLIGRSVRAARTAKGVDAVYVSTDDAEIARAATGFGAGIIERPAELATDAASSESALLHALEVLAARGEHPEFTVFLQCTSPFTTGADIDACLAALRERRADAAFSAAEDHGFLWTEGPDGYAAGVNHDHQLPRRRRQELPPQYRETGAVYVMRTGAFLATGTRFCGATLAVPLKTPVVEIDSEDDLVLCNMIARAVEQHQPPYVPAGIRALVMDFDGVLTDDRVEVDETGRESVRCSRADGMGIAALRQAGFELLILSREANSVVSARGRKLGIPVLQNELDKLTALRAWAERRGLAMSQIAYMGNDINDIDCLGAVGWAVVPRDAHPRAERIAHYVTRARGGNGAVREVADLLIAHVSPERERAPVAA